MARSIITAVVAAASLGVVLAAGLPLPLPPPSSNRTASSLPGAAGSRASPSTFARSPWRQAERAARARGVKPGIEHYASGGYPYVWEEKWFPAFVDNFNFNGPSSTDTYQMRYLYNDTWWSGPNGPIFLYAGNEGFIELFAANTGALWELAPAYGALVVFAEHRYYGLSLPFGNASYDVGNLGPLGAEQAIADYANFIVSLKANLSSPNSPVIVWGGSYGGMLAAWMRYKYPGVVQGAIASSAPILQVPGLMPPGLYNNIVTNDFAEANSAAPVGIYNTWQAMFGLMGTQAGRDEIAQHLHMCGTLQSEDDVWNVIYWLNGAIGFMAMADYPYPANFLGPFPAFPARVAGQAFTAPNGTAEQLLDSMYQVAFIFANYSGQAGPCFNLTADNPPGLQGDGWDIQCCKEVAQPIGQYGLPNDMFWPAPFNLSAFIQGCQQQFDGLTPRPYWVQTQYGGWDLEGLSNVVFANGVLDPWLSGGITHNVSGTNDVIAFVIQEGAHHLDLRASDPLDPPSVIEARLIESAAMTRWINQHYERKGIDMRV